MPRFFIGTALLLVAAGAPAQPATDPGASILFFPRVVADAEQDTIIQLANAAGRVTLARCRYVDAAGQSGEPFEVALVDRQPTHWVVSRGRLDDPLDVACNREMTDCDGAGRNPGRIPAVAAPFSGGLACVQIDRSGAPLSGNALRGTATLVDDAGGDVAKYSALGLAGFETNDGDEVLCLDGDGNPACAVAEYAACPPRWHLGHPADGVQDPLDAERRIRSTITALPCALALGGAAADVQLEVDTTNEFDQSFSAAATIAPVTSLRLSDVSSILDRASSGGDFLQTRIAAGTAPPFMLVTESERTAVERAATGRTARAAHAGDGGAAILTFPYVQVNGAAGVDTAIQVSNVSPEPLRARCTYEDLTPHCADGGGSPSSCLPGGSGCGDSSCVPGYQTVEFGLDLTAGQPLGWRAGSGIERELGPGQERDFLVPALGDVFLGTLRCVVVDQANAPRDLNGLIGTAWLETGTAAADGGTGSAIVDAADYDAIGQTAVPGGNNGDEFLVLGGAQPEYEACPGVLVVPHLFDFATTRTGTRQDTSLTTLALAPCATDLAGDAGAGVVAQFLVYNEYAQRFSTSRSINGQLVRQMSLLDTSEPTRSIFSVGVGGTLAGNTYVLGFPAGLLGVAIERHQGAGTAPPSSAAIELFAEAPPAAFEVLALPAVCAGDCNRNGSVQINELLLGVNVSLGAQRVDACGAFDLDGNGAVSIGELIRAVQASLNGCPLGERPAPSPEPTPQPTEPPSSLGPELNFFGVVSGDDLEVQPSGTNPDGLPVFTRPHGEGFALVLEARRGTENRPPGVTAYDESGASLPDLQIIVSRPLGDGSAAICDVARPNQGGVPATDPLSFEGDVLAAVNDLGCRVDDGLGEPRGAARTPCSRKFEPDGFYSTTGMSERQFCLPIAQGWAFPPGDTVVAARIRSINGTLGPVRQIVVRVE